MLKYPLLLKEIRKGTPDSHADKENLNEAMVQMQGLAKVVNETMRTYENVQDIAANMKGCESSTGDESCAAVCAKGGATPGYRDPP